MNDVEFARRGNVDFVPGDEVNGLDEGVLKRSRLFFDPWLICDHPTTGPASICAVVSFMGGGRRLCAKSAMPFALKGSA